MSSSSSNNTNFDTLPGECISTILSLTSPLDACRSSLVSSEFKSAAESDLVWDRFLPTDHKDLVSRAFDSVLISTSSSSSSALCCNSTKKELFVHLCNSVLIDGGNKILALERSSGHKSYIISPRQLAITWSDIPTYWCWKSVPQSRFREVAELITTSWLEIRCEIDLKSLSTNTTYGAHLIYRAAERSYGLETMPMEASVKVTSRDGVGECSRTVAVRLRGHCERDEMAAMMEEIWYANRSQMLASRLDEDLSSGSADKYDECGGRGRGGGGEGPRLREDGYWMEVELGKFFVDDDGEKKGSGDRTVKIGVTEIKGHHLKGGLIVGGIQVRPEMDRTAA